jgi:hypothetical protein
MTPHEQSEGHDPSAQPPAAGSKTEIGITPYPDEVIVFEEQRGGTHTLSFRGKVTIEGEITIAIRPPATFKASESPVPPSSALDSGLLPDSTSPPVTEQHSADNKPSWEQSLTEDGQIPESENRKFQLVGNPARKPGYRVTRKSNTRIADFVLATHPDQETTEYWRIRAFGDQAEKVRDQVQVGQKGVEVTVYGPKYWKGRKKTKDGWEDTVVKGYHAGFVKVPRKYRVEKASEKPPT